ncbi:hypothetical protein F5Y16DRAFT_128288 [Xylariaceae sp. FL0255]|nr:hypothetical protein F5Y16DRAFT_128288 [Xylariaceae sp. FL0255]
MNWTEGNLARHSRARQRNVLLARQKQHFAKVRNNLLSTNNSQRPIVISFQRPHNSSDTNGHGLFTAIRREPLSNPSASTSKWDLELNLSAQESPNSPCHNHDQRTVDVDSKRRKLLARTDWTGLRLQDAEPLNVNFPGQFYIGRRWGSESRPSRKRSHPARDGFMFHDEDCPRAVKKSRMRIQIGSQEIRPSIETGSELSARLSERESSSGWDGSMSYEISASRSSPSTRAMSSSENHLLASVSLSDNPAFTGSERAHKSSETPACVSYASLDLHEPAPLRTNPYPVLRWSETDSASEDRGSMKVEIERRIRPVPPSQESDQRRWKDWVLSDSSPNSSLNAQSTAISLTPVSPWASRSSASLPSQLQRSLPILELDSLSNGQPYEHSLSSLDDTHQVPLGHIQQPSGSVSEHPNGRVSRVGDPVLANDALGQKLDQTQPRRAVVEDLNAQWMQFAYGDDEDDSEEILMNAFKEAAHQAAKELVPSETSHSISDQTDVSATCRTSLRTVDEDIQNSRAIYEDDPSGSHIAIHGTNNTESVSSNMATMASSGDRSIGKPHFKIPKPFEGKFAEPKFLPDIRFGRDMATVKKGGRGRRKKRALDGRTDIRCLPDFNDDPIEDIDDT